MTALTIVTSPDSDSDSGADPASRPAPPAVVGPESTPLTQVAPSLQALAARATAFAAAARAGNTRRAYRASWSDFTTWCSSRALHSLPADAETVALFLAERAATLKPATLELRLVAIRQAHRAAGHDAPASRFLADVRRGIRCTLGTRPKQKTALLPDLLRMLIDNLPGDLRGSRDRAILLLGFASGLRRTEIAALDLADLAADGTALQLTVRRAKADQEGAGAGLVIPRTAAYCPVAAIDAWIAASGLTSGPLFRGLRGSRIGAAISDRTIARAVQRAAAGAGLDSTGFGGHSLRSGLATTAALRGETVLDLMGRLRQKSPKAVAPYVRMAAEQRPAIGIEPSFPASGRTVEPPPPAYLTPIPQPQSSEATWAT